ncbi:hypothetical protein GF351_05675 [Candidatus Woesearchaeota archaeon]|nr:hypothetical protein [Candidatus Woesearchaeota archaeon]
MGQKTSISIDKKMLRNIGIAVAVLLVAWCAYAIFLNTNVPDDVPEYYSTEPESWIRHDIDYEQVNESVIDIEKATQGRSSADEIHQRYAVHEGIVGFYYYGAYKGETFQTAYVPEGIYNQSLELPHDEAEELLEDHIRMRISNVMHPGDGVIEGIIVARLEGVELSFHVFVDEDWKKQVKDTNIIIGENLQYEDSLSTQMFRYDQHKDGVYFQEVKGEMSWFRTNPRRAGVVVGNLTAHLVADENIQGKTVMVLR